MARQKAVQTARDMAGNVSALMAARRANAHATRGLRAATRHNKKCGPGAILVLIDGRQRRRHGRRLP